MQIFSSQFKTVPTVIDCLSPSLIMCDKILLKSLAVRLFWVGWLVGRTGADDSLFYGVINSQTARGATV